MKALKRFWNDERGMETVEWAILAALIAAGLVGIIAAIGGKVKNAFTNLNAGW